MDGTSPLWLAANAPDDGGESAALELLSNGAKADIVGSRGGTALHGAAFHGREQLAARLIAAGCPVNAVNSKTSYTALHTAAETKHPKVGGFSFRCAFLFVCLLANLKMWVRVVYCACRHHREGA